MSNRPETFPALTSSCQYLLFSQRKSAIVLWETKRRRNAVTPKQKTDVLAGARALMVLKTLGVLGSRIEQMSGHLLTVNQGALHPASPKLELQGANTFGGGASENNRLSREGRKPFQGETPDWAQTEAIIARFFGAKAEDWT
jgi:hypothetical protein